MTLDWEVVFNEVAERVTFPKESFLHKMLRILPSNHCDETQLMLWVKGEEMTLVARVMVDRWKWLIGACKSSVPMKRSFFETLYPFPNL